MPTQPIDLLVTNTVTYLDGKLAKGMYQLFKKHMGYKPDDAIFMVKNSKNKWNKEWDGTISTVCYNKKWCKCSIKKDGKIGRAHV